eukprot:CAMPEP_0184544772 /NCGR_PEP_ID=MMETSP0199_2-20130426/3852_1 /TAXON_ID=1112570 /ORGANISM="Thraustochytrium sp., Strain LLF1b" /LENGTH=1596 /DNA_ID=CAMNT_0026938995 /DNA_START=145 /DNA_END=4935 /DNA_ORIENTATION=+
MSGRRSARMSSKKQMQLEALKEIKEVRELGLRRDDGDDSDSQDDMYEYLDEEEYQRRKQKLKEEGDFVVDDDGTGYKDNYDDDEEDNIVQAGAAARGSASDKKGRGKIPFDDGKNQKLSSMFTKIATSTKRKNAVGSADNSVQTSSSKAKEKAAEKSLEDASLANMLENMVSTAGSTKKKKKRKTAASASKSSKKLRKGSRRGALDEEDEELLGVDASTGVHGAFAKDDNEDVAMHDGESDEGTGPTTCKQEMDTAEAPAEGVSTPKAEVKEEPSSETEEDMKAKMLSAARQKPVRSVPKMAAPSTPPRSSAKDTSLTFMATPPTAFGSIDCGEDGSGWSTSGPKRPVPEGDMPMTTSADSSTGNKPACVETDKNGNDYFDMYYMDMYEDYFNNRGSVYLFGKVWCEKRKEHVSCSVQVRNISRVLYVLPREQYRDDPSREVEFKDVLDEFKDTVINKVLPMGADGSRAFKCKPTKLKYAFELPDVPREETEYLEVHYPMSAEKFRLDGATEGNTYKRVFGGQQSASEQFVLSRELKGPMWIRINKARFPDLSTTWCKYHAEVDAARCITPLLKIVSAEHTDSTKSISVPPPPKLRVMSLSLKTVVNEKTHEHEVVMASGLVRDNVDLVSATPNSGNSSEVTAFTIVRGGKGKLSLPGGFAEKARKAAGHVHVQSNERALLSFLVVQLQKLDPDVILGHNIRQFDLDVLLTRMKANSVSMWSKLGRLRLSKMPQKRADGGGFYTSASLTPGRLLLDTYVMAKELLLGQRSYTLSELCRTQLGRPRNEVQPAAVPFFFQTNDLLLKLVTFSEADAWLTLQLSFKLEAMPLTLQLSSLAGNVWSRTLAGGRAERIEYLLLHEFSRKGYLVPDKYGSDTSKKGGKFNKTPAAKSRSKTRKPKYDGGLVLEPKKGLYDKYVLVLDFNSLYPSIIQEYNICYTTVERQRSSTPEEVLPVGEVGEFQHEGNEPVVELDEGEVLPPLPDLAVHQELAILPSLIRMLVERRKVVKRELKVEKDSAKRDQLEVRQKALKITANSMYGCLGFNGFRFFAKPVAALVTSQGRSILQNTVNLTQDKLGYEVVYGDTDSIMVNTNTTDLDMVKQAGATIKKEVNKMYRMLEIDLDGIFKTLLLLKKKKYAALAVAEVRGPDGKLTIETSKETKGLDLVRRDWCALSKRVGHTVLDFILSGKSYDEIVEGIHEYLEVIQGEIKEHKVKMEEYVITKGLNKAPKDYPDAKSQPHLSVALAMVDAGKPVNTGDHIPYVICTLTRGEFEEKRKALAEAQLKGEEAPASANDEMPATSSRGSYAERAFHPDEIENDTMGLLKIDIDWYLKQQIVPPTQRLCESIDGTSREQIAMHLGLDPASFRQTYNNGGDDGDDLLNISTVTDAERFKNCKRLTIECASCSFQFPFAPGGVATPELVDAARASLGEDAKKPANPTQCENGLQCPKCGNEVDPAWLANMLFLAARSAVSTYYNGWLVSDDPSVELRTRQQTVLGRTYVLNGRRLQLVPEHGPGQLYTQLKYLETLVDSKRALSQLEAKNLRAKSSIRPPVLRADQRDNMDALRGAFSDQFIKTSAYNWVEPSLFQHAFSLMKK